MNWRIDLDILALLGPRRLDGFEHLDNESRKLLGLPPTLTYERLRELLTYDPKTGLFRWRVDRGWGGTKAGSVAGKHDRQGYREIRVDRRGYRAARLAWLYMTGEWPEHEVDHRDLDKLNDRWRNLRPATRQQNSQNTRVGATNTSGFKGVHQDRASGKWQAQIKHNGHSRYLGRFKTPEEAHAAYCEASKRMHSYGRTS